MAFGGYSNDTYQAVGLREKAFNRETGAPVRGSFDVSQAIHVWAQRTQTSGQSAKGNVYFRGDVLFDYGPHFILGQFVETARGAVAVLLNSDTRSPTTSEHKGITARAVRHYAPNVFTVPGAKADHAANLESYAARLAAAEKAAASPKANEWARDYLTETLSGLMAEAKAYAKAFGLRFAPAAAMRKADATADRERKAEAKRQRQENARTGRAIGLMSDSDFADYQRRNYTGREIIGANVHNIDREEERAEAFAKLLYRALRDAKAEGVGKRALAKLAERRKAFNGWRAGIRVRAVAAYRADLAAKFAPWALSDAADRARLSHDDSAEAQAGRVKSLESSGLRSWQFPEGSTEREALESAEAFASAYKQAADKARAVAAFADWAPVWQAAKSDADKLAAAERKGRPSQYGFPNDSPEHALLKEAGAFAYSAAAYAVREALAVEAFEAWQRGERRDCPKAARKNGAAYVRRIGDELETSEGASVPWRHAVRAFQFVALCRAKGKGWRANGQSVRVGLFHVDSITARGDMRAGCHFFQWSDMEALALRHGVALAPSAEAVEGAAH